MCERNTISTSEEDQVIPVMLAVQHGLSESPMLWGEEIDRMCSIELQKRGAPHGHFAIIFVDDTSVGVTQRDDKQLEELQKKGAPHEHFALIIVDDTDMDGVTLQHKQLEELGASFREYKTEHLALIFVDDAIDPTSTPITTALRPRRLAWQSQLKIRRLSKIQRRNHKRCGMRLRQNTRLLAMLPMLRLLMDFFNRCPASRVQQQIRNNCGNRET